MSAEVLREAASLMRERDAHALAVARAYLASSL